jgi:hypothetical protein
MPRWITATVQIEADRGSLFLKGQPRLGLRENDKRNVAIQARAAPTFQSRKRMKMLRGSS